LSHTYPGDLDILLVGPDGVRVGLLGRVGGGTDAVNATITFDDEATASVGSSVTSGTFRPTGVTSSLPSPAPAAPYGTALSAFNGASPNGNWTLYVVDRAAVDLGSISGGWRLDITTVQSSCCGDGGQPPVVTLNSPTVGTAVASGQPLALSASATASGELEDGSPRVIDRVEFLVDGQIVATDSTVPYAATWTPPAAGAYALAARAWDNGNLSTTTVPSTVTVLVGNGAPSITSFSPASGAAGGSVTITGVNFASVSAVRFNGVNATAYTVDSATQITAVVPAGASAGALSVVTSFGVATSSTNFTVVESPVLISQIYGAGGNTGAVYNADYVELHNRSGSVVSLAGWSLQYASASGTSWSAKVDLAGTIAPGGYFLIRLSGGPTGAALPAPDFTGAISMSATQGKIALRNTTVLFTGSSPEGQSGLQDFVGFGAANAYEGSAAAPSPSATTAIFRAAGGATDSGDNGADFSTGPPAPRNSSGSVQTPVIDSPLAAAAVVGQPFSYRITASNSPSSFAAAGLPDGLSLETTTGVITGSPVSSGVYQIALSASNVAGTGPAELVLTVTESGGGAYLVDFEDGSKAGYAAGIVRLNGIDWNLIECLIGTEEAEFKTGLKSARLRGYGISEMVMLNDKPGGIGTISLRHRRYGS
ncbi:MAG: Ig-like domain-containing protein, partial [Chthoniobacterales bacterium]